MNLTSNSECQKSMNKDYENKNKITIILVRLDYEIKERKINLLFGVSESGNSSTASV